MSLQSPILILSALLLSTQLWGFTPESNSEIWIEGGYRFSGTWDTQRLLGQTALELNESPWEARLSVWGWKNFQFQNYSMQEFDLALRTAKLSYWSDTWGLSGGLGELHWGETYGMQPTDLVNARNYRDFPLLDHDRNRIPALLFSGFKQIDTWKLEGFVNPMGTLPVLPDTLRGLAVVQPDRGSYFWNHPEMGFRVGQELSQGRWNAFALRHGSRFPALVLVPTATTLQWDARYAQVNSLGSSFSYSTGDWVVRADAVGTPDHPCSDGLQVASCVVYSLVTGADWTVTSLDNLTVGAQWHIDRFPTTDSRARHGASLFLSKSFLADQVRTEATGFVGASLRDRWVRLKATWSLNKICTVGALAEWIEADSRSALTLFSDLSRVMGQMKFFF